MNAAPRLDISAHPLPRAPSPISVKVVDADGSWRPAVEGDSPALRLQQRLHDAMANDDALPILPVPGIELAIRFVSRAAGYVALATALSALGWIAFR